MGSYPIMSSNQIVSSYSKMSSNQPLYRENRLKNAEIKQK